MFLLNPGVRPQGTFLSELFRNALWLNYLEKPSELKFQGSE
jgi:hypothetical protein